MNIGQRITRIRRSDIDKLFEQTKPVKSSQEAIEYDIKDCYTIKEILQKFQISDSALNNIIKRNSIPKLKKGWFTYVPKGIIDGLLK